MRVGRRKKKANPKWKEHLYISRQDVTVLILYNVKWRVDKTHAAGGFTEMKQAKSWAEKNWETALQEKIESILLVDK